MATRKRKLSPVPTSEDSDEDGVGDPKHSRENNPSITSTTASSSSDDGKIKFRRQECVTEIIKPEVSDWKVHGITSIFHALPIKVTYLGYSDFRQRLLSETLQLVDPRGYHADRDLHVSELGDAVLNFVRQANDVTQSLHYEMMVSVPEEWGNVRGKWRKYGNYPSLDQMDLRKSTDEKVPHTFFDQTKRLHDHLVDRVEGAGQHPDGNDVENLRATLTNNMFPKMKALMVADDFLEEILQFMVNQQEITEHGFESLFASFCAVAGLKLRFGGIIDERKMSVFGVPVSCAPDLMAVRHLLSQIKRTKRVSQLRSPTVAVVKVKSSDGGCQGTQSDSTRTTRSTAGPSFLKNEAEDSIEDVLGQLAGEMIAEIVCGKAALSGSMVGFAVQCTKVQMVIMNLHEDLINYITNDPEFPMKEYTGKRGEIWCSLPLDILSINDRPDLWKLVSIVAASTLVV